MNMLENFKESKKVMLIKLEQANDMANNAIKEFANSILSLVKDASGKDVKMILNSDDESIDEADKIAIFAAFAAIDFNKDFNE